MQINVSSNINTFAKAIDAFGKNQLPHATAMALNETAKDVRANTIDNVWPSDVNVKNPRFMKFALTPISRRNPEVFATKKMLRAVVGNTKSERRRDYLQRLTTGGIKTPRGRNLAIPARDLTNRTKGGAVRKADRPRQLLNRKKVFVTKLAKSGQDAIVRRVGKERYPLQMLYILEPSGRIRKQFSFYDDANKTARRAMLKHFPIAFEKAKRTARRR